MIKKEQDKADLEKALKIRKRIKEKKPKFARQESWRYKRLKESWRRPRGLDNKMRRNIKGWPSTVGVGYRGPKAARGLHPSGYREVLVHNVKEVKEVDPEIQAVRIAHAVGKRKRGKILVEARKRNIRVLNFRELEEAIKEEEKEAVKEEQPEEKKEEQEITEKEETESGEKKAKRTKEEQGNDDKS